MFPFPENVHQRENSASLCFPSSMETYQNTIVIFITTQRRINGYKSSLMEEEEEEENTQHYS